MAKPEKKSVFTIGGNQVNQAIEWKDEYYISEDRKVLTEKELQIPGLQTFGHHHMHTAVAPLENHYHHHCIEVTYISKGVINFSIEKTNYKLKGGDVFITFSDEVHSTNLSPLSVGEIYWFQLNVKDFKEVLFLNEEASLDLLFRLNQISQHLISIKNREVLTYFRSAFSLCKRGEKHYMAASYLALFLQQLLKACNSPEVGLSGDIEDSVRYILENLKKDVSLDELAFVSGLSTSQYKQKFKVQMGIPPRNYINLQKIELAKKMIKEGMEITEIAMELGFNTSSYFAVVFKRYAACSPTEYRKNHL